jgi:hypothetical protein
MPYMSNGKRDYKKEEALHEKKHPERDKARAQRNRARGLVAKKAGVSRTALKGDVGHKKAVSKGGRNGLANLFVQNPGENRSFSRNAKGAMTSETSKRERKKA